MTAIFVISGLISVLYVITITCLSKGILRLEKHQIFGGNKENLSIIIAYRNEEKHLPELISSLKNLSKENRNIEIIFVNDHSEDASEVVLSEMIKDCHHLNFTLISMADSKGLSGKKQALKMGVESASYDILLFTDADCGFDSQWAESMASLLNENIVLVCGPVVYNQSGKFMNRLFHAEFLGLVLSSAGAFGIHQPVYCNGANLLVRKSAYLKAHKNMSGQSFASGDDVFLLHAVLKEYGQHAAQFAFSEKCIVRTDAPLEIFQFLSQRMRWASKSVAYTNNFAIFLAFLVFFNCLMIFALMIAGLFVLKLLVAGLATLILKAFADAVLFSKGRTMHINRWLPLQSIPMQLLYIPYIVIVAPLSMFLRPEWKGRKYK